MHLTSTPDGRKAHPLIRSGIILIAAILLFALLSAVASAGRAEVERSDRYLSVRVLEILARDEQVYDSGMRDLTLTFTADANGKTITATQFISDSVILGDNREIEPGNRVIITNSAPDGNTPVYNFVCYVRLGPIIVLGCVFALLLLLFGRRRGLMALLSLLLTCAAIFGCFIPAVLAGRNIYLWTAITCAYVTVFALALIGDGGRKSIAATLGCLGGLAVAALVMAVTDLFLKMTGSLDESTTYLLYLDTPAPIDLRALLYAAVLIGALGAVMDVSVDIAAALHEIAEKVERPGFSELMRSGITIGRDLIGTMVNTLVLAYIGSALTVVLLIAGSTGTSLLYIFNREQIIFEFLQSLVGSFGILIAIPLTAAASALLFRRTDTADPFTDQLIAAEREESEKNSGENQLHP